MEKVRVTQEFLYSYLKEHGITISCIARHMGVIPAHVNSMFLHHNDSRGNPRRFTKSTLAHLNQTIQEVAEELRQHVIQFGSDQTYTNRLGNTYDPGTLPAIKELSEYVNLALLCENVLGWDRNRKSDTFCSPKTKRYGRISKDDVDRINAELLSVAGVLSSYEVVEDDDKKNAAPDIPGKEFSDADLDAYEEELLLPNA